MQLDITDYWNNGSHWETSNSIANLGEHHAKQCWPNAVEQAQAHHDAEQPYVAPTNAQEVRDHYATFGAWDDEEIDSWSYVHLEAMILQEVSSIHNNISEGPHMGDDGEINWLDYRADEESNGSISEGPDDRIYFYVGL